MTARLALYWFFVAWATLALAFLLLTPLAARRTRCRAGELIAPAVRLDGSSSWRSKAFNLVALGGLIWTFGILSDGLPGWLIALLAGLAVACLIAGIRYARVIPLFILELRRNGILCNGVFTPWDAIRSYTWIAPKPGAIRLRMRLRTTVVEIPLAASTKEIVQPILASHAREQAQSAVRP